LKSTKIKYYAEYKVTDVAIFPGYLPHCDGMNGTDFAIARLEGFLPKADLPYSKETYF
jgi:hypothetical protein